MENLQKNRGQASRQSRISERDERENLVKQFNKDEEKKNLKNLLFGAGHFPDAKDSDEE